MTHDHRCPSLRYVVLGHRVCVCPVIAEVREDMLTKCIEAVESLTFFSGDDKEQALASMRALQGKP